MNGLIIDAGPLYALADRDDAYHHQSLTLLSTHPGPLIVPIGAVGGLAGLGGLAAIPPEAAAVPADAPVPTPQTSSLPALTGSPVAVGAPGAVRPVRGRVRE